MTTYALNLLYPFTWCWENARSLTIVDYSAAISIRTINSLSSLVLQNPPINPEHGKTAAQKKRDIENATLQQKLGVSSAYVQAAKISSDYVDCLVPKIAADKLGQVPGAAFQMAMYWAGLTARYAKRQIDKKLDASNSLSKSAVGQGAEVAFQGARTHLARTIVSRENLLPFISIENLALTFFSKIAGQTPNKGSSQKLIGLIVKSLGSSFSHENDITQFINRYSFRSEEDKMIARIRWHQDKGHLKGILPGKEVDLQRNNLEQELDKALSNYVRGALDHYLQKDGPKLGLVTSFLFWLEGKDLLLDIASSLFIDYAFKLAVDPHLFTLQVLYTTGVEIAEYELDGFGLDSKTKILQAGQEMMKFAASSYWSPAFIFHKSNLKCPQGGFTTLEQKYAAKEKLIAHITKLIQSQIGTAASPYTVDGIVASFTKSVTNVPVVGMATSMLHLLIAAILSSVNPQALLTHVKEEVLCKHFAKRIVELIYHPSWRITLTELLVVLIDYVSHTHVPEVEKKEYISHESFKQITRFLFSHFTQDLPVPQQPLNALFDYFAEEKVFRAFKAQLKPSGKPLFETVAESSLGAIKELMLYAKVTEMFRKRFVSFDGDAKFWEVYIREALNLRLQKEFSEQSPPPTLDQLAVRRQQFVDELLALNPQDLKVNLAKIDIPLPPPRVEQMRNYERQSGYLLQQVEEWEPLERVQPPQPAAPLPPRLNGTINVQSDYLANLQ